MMTVTTARGRALDEVTCELRSAKDEPTPWRVRAATVVEGLSELYEATLDLAADEDASPDPLCGQRVRVVLARGPLGSTAHRRTIRGVVRRVEDLGATATARLARAVVVPELWALSQRVGSEIYQDVTALDVVRRVLERAGLYEGRLVMPDGVYPPRAYCAQYRESELDFVRRLLEHEGIGFYFGGDEAGETLVLFDGARGLVALPTMDGGAVPVAGDEAETASVECFRRFDRAGEVVPTGVLLRDHDFTRPLASADMTRARPPLSGEAAAGAPAVPRGPGDRVVYLFPGDYTLHGYQGAAHTRHDGDALARVRRDEVQWRERSCRGRGTVVTCAPGRVFELANHLRDDLSGARLLAARVEHAFVAPDELRDEAAGERPPAAHRYHNVVDAVVVDADRLRWRPARATPRPIVHGAQTATVVGPPGEEVFTDAHGRVKVLFHWDLRGPEGDEAHRTCWIRVAQSWGGAGWGAQFIPRVGMEVVVTFLEGDPDRPLVTGCVYNGTHPMPFTPPAARTRSGFRTQTSPGGGGFNELSFEDAVGAEQVYLHAQRDLDEVARNDRTGWTGRDETVRVVRHHTLQVGGDRTERVEGNRRVRVKADHAERIEGSRETVVVQEDTLRVEGNRYAVSKNDDRVVTHDLTTRVGGSERRDVAGPCELTVRDDLVTRVEGNQVTVVGRHDAKRTALLHAEGRAVVESSDLTEITSDKELILRVGASRIRITDERIELMGKQEITLRTGNTTVQLRGDRVRVRSPGKAVVSAGEVTLATDLASVKLSRDAELSGVKVRLNPAKEHPTPDEKHYPPEPTTIELQGEDGAPLEGRRFILHLDDDAEVAGVLDRDGRAALELEGGAATVTFPEVRGVRSA